MTKSVGIEGGLSRALVEDSIQEGVEVTSQTMTKYIVDESQGYMNMASDELSREFIMERIKDVGDGSPFIYDTIVIPTTVDTLRSMKADSDESLRNLSHMFDVLCERDTKTGLLGRIRRYLSMTPLREKIEGIIRLESEILSNVDKVLDSGCTNDVDRYIIASAMKTMMKVNKQIEVLISNTYKDSREIRRESSILHEYDSELRVHKDSVMGVSASA